MIPSSGMLLEVDFETRGTNLILKKKFKGSTSTLTGFLEVVADEIIFETDSKFLVQVLLKRTLILTFFPAFNQF